MGTECKSGWFLAVVVLCLSLPTTAGLVLDFQAAQQNVLRLSISLVTESDSATTSVNEQFIKSGTTEPAASCTNVSFAEVAADRLSECSVDWLLALEIPKDINGQSGILFVPGSDAKSIFTAER